MNRDLVCSFPACSKAVWSRGLCGGHYQQQHVGMVLRPLYLRPAGDLGKRFWSKVDKNGPVHPVLGTPCWLWTERLSHGYGTITVGGRKGKAQKAHRVAWTLGVGPIPDGQFVLHRCDVRNCVNYEAHLFLGTKGDNNRDRAEKGRSAKRWSERRRSVAPTSKRLTAGKAA